MRYKIWFFILLFCTVTQSFAMSNTDLRVIPDDKRLKDEGEAIVSSLVGRHSGVIVDSLYQDLFIGGFVPSEPIKNKIVGQANAIKRKSKVTIELTVGKPYSRDATDKKIDTTIASRVKSLSLLGANRVRTVTIDRVTYVMGSVTHDEGKAVSAAVQKVEGINKIILLYSYHDKTPWVHVVDGCKVVGSYFVDSFTWVSRTGGCVGGLAAGDGSYTLDSGKELITVQGLFVRGEIFSGVVTLVEKESGEKIVYVGDVFQSTPTGLGKATGPRGSIEGEFSFWTPVKITKLTPLSSPKLREVAPEVMAQENLSASAADDDERIHDSDDGDISRDQALSILAGALFNYAGSNGSKSHSDVVRHSSVQSSRQAAVASLPTKPSAGSAETMPSSGAGSATRGSGANNIEYDRGYSECVVFEPHPTLRSYRQFRNTCGFQVQVLRCMVTKNQDGCASKLFGSFTLGPYDTDISTADSVNWVACKSPFEALGSQVTVQGNGFAAPCQRRTR
ncbi:BON domain-containing protein [Pseudomonas sp. JAI120]|uniref:BON domain-containing protein n=1 Tax=Pseudomonas sp. JAI120 TaxID=2723063 RepID=UPI0030DA3614